MTLAAVENIDTSALSERQRNGLAILEHLPVDDVNHIKDALKLSNPGVIGPQTLDAFVGLADGAGIDLSDAGVNRFKTDHGLGNSGALAGVIGAQTAGFYFQAIAQAIQAAAGAAGAQHINQAGLDLVKEFEGYERLVAGTTDVTAYPDPGTGGAPFTIGYGHTGPDVHPGLVIDKPRAEALLRSDLAGAEADVAREVVVALNENEFSALVSFTFNVGGGSGGLATSTLLHLLNAGDRRGAADQFPRWNKGGKGQIMAGLVRRRAAERALFLTPAG
jgi:GH24 family phage-related lysozyme (muramidase)